MLNIVIDKNIPYIAGVFESVANVEYLSAEAMNCLSLKNVDAIIVRTRTNCNSSLLDGTNVRFIASATIGYDHIDAEYCKDNGIEWVSSPGCNSLAVAQYIASVFAMLESKKNIDISQKTIGIVGVGSVGSKIKELAESIGMRVLLNDPPLASKMGNEQFVTLDKIGEEADVITFHTWLDRITEYKTFHLADDAFFEKLKRKPIIINTARGEVVSNIALKKALISGMVSEAIIDCWESEPYIDKELLKLAFIATPHIAGYSADGKARATTQVVRAVSRFFGLGVDEWEVNCDNLESVSEINTKTYSELFLKTYDIEQDDRMLRLDYGGFENQRSNYHFRRELKAYKDMSTIAECADFWSRFKLFG